MKFSGLKILSLALAAVGALVANEVHKRETRDMIEEALDKREADRQSSHLAQ